MLRQETLSEIESGSISLAFRRWRRPTVRTGGTLLTAIGQLSIDAVERVGLEEITTIEAIAAGFADLESLRRFLTHTADGEIYRVRLSLRGPDPRIALREEVPSADEEFEPILERLDRMDARTASGPWTRCVLDLISNHPGTVASRLAREVGMDVPDFKARVRKLKTLGLTESLAIGYRLSPRGIAVLERSSRAP